MLLVAVGFVELAVFQQLDDPARVEIDTEANAAAELGEVLDGQPQSPRTGRPEHQPMAATWEMLVRQRLRHYLVIDPVVLDDDSRFRHTGRASGLKDIN